MEKLKMITQLFFIFTLPAVYNHPATKFIRKRSPLDIRTSFDNVPRIYIPQNGPHNIPLVLTPVLAPHSVVRLLHGSNLQSKVKGPNVDHTVKHQMLTPITHLYPQAISNVHKLSVHTNVKHVITKDNMKIPILTHTISHSSSNISHPVKPILLPVHSGHGIFVPVPKPLVLLHDTSVIPLRKEHRLQNLISKDRQDRQRSESITADSDDEMQSLRNPIGGFGPGFRFGGHGAGHGFFAYV